MVNDPVWLPNEAVWSFILPPLSASIPLENLPSFVITIVLLTAASWINQSLPSWGILTNLYSTRAGPGFRFFFSFFFFPFSHYSSICRIISSFRLIPVFARRAITALSMIYSVELMEGSHFFYRNKLSFFWSLLVTTDIRVPNRLPSKRSARDY